MTKLKLRSQIKKPAKWWVIFWVIALSWGLVSCSDRLVASPPPSLISSPEPVNTGKLAEVPPPESIQALRRSLDQYQPQVKILSPQPEQVLEETSIAVKLAVQDFPLFQNAEFGLGPHLHLILDNEPYQAVYDVNQPVILNNLTPGTHTLRVFASRPWHESFKNDGAYAQATFHVLTKTEDNRPDPTLPLLTYSRPKGDYGAEPILLDFYLTNAPLHVLAQESQDDAIADWRIRVTINGESFILDNWQPIYLKGFESGKNWVKLEFIDEQGNTVPNVFNNTVRVINYQPNGQDSLSKLVRGEIPLNIAKAIVNPAITVDEVDEMPEEAIAAPPKTEEKDETESLTESPTPSAAESVTQSSPASDQAEALTEEPAISLPEKIDAESIQFDEVNQQEDNPSSIDAAASDSAAIDEPFSSAPQPTLLPDEAKTQIEEMPVIPTPTTSSILLPTETKAESIYL